ncbi:hypothetical protein M422DRAFT_271176 [Sphaerobolus stellatus SS14]|uniref:JmjC domain-containing protein n=1 Tax=Sphaerobolus stellatus (strain SS14) TaxID=990650 RepID=A0A0C9UF38_SPHS4|nr:hypothetical protein M422DRAFT_271176 [Sphaerobolus stellatus SS14]
MYDDLGTIVASEQHNEDADALIDIAGTIYHAVTVEPTLIGWKCVEWPFKINFQFLVILASLSSSTLLTLAPSSISTSQVPPTSSLLVTLNSSMAVQSLSQPSDTLVSQPFIKLTPKPPPLAASTLRGYDSPLTQLSDADSGNEDEYVDVQEEGRNEEEQEDGNEDEDEDTDMQEDSRDKEVEEKKKGKNPRKSGNPPGGTKRPTTDEPDKQPPTKQGNLNFHHGYHSIHFSKTPHNKYTFELNSTSDEADIPISWRMVELTCMVNSEAGFFPEPITFEVPFVHNYNGPHPKTGRPVYDPESTNLESCEKLWEKVNKSDTEKKTHKIPVTGVIGVDIVALEDYDPVGTNFAARSLKKERLLELLHQGCIHFVPRTSESTTHKAEDSAYKMFELQKPDDIRKAYHIQVDKKTQVQGVRWKLLPVQSGSTSLPHIDAAGLGTWLWVVEGVKYWATANLTLTTTTDLTTLYFLQVEWTHWILESGHEFLMKPHTIHFVVSLTDCIVEGGHCYFPNTLYDTIWTQRNEYLHEDHNTNTQHVSVKYILHGGFKEYHDRLVNTTLDTNSRDFKDNIWRGWPETCQMAALIIMCMYPDKFAPATLNGEPSDCAVELIDVREEVFRKIPYILNCTSEIAAEVELLKEELGFRATEEDFDADGTISDQAQALGQSMRTEEEEEEAEEEEDATQP